MFVLDISKYVPKFIMDDRNGYAIAKAFEAGLKLFNSKVYAAVKIMYDVDLMPEWRLDEVAWETQCFYDYTATIALKRQWIKDAIRLYRIHGTKRAMENYISTYFDDVVIFENWEYSGDPYHFRVIAFGDEWNTSKSQWLNTAIAQSKNARSVLDYVGPGTLATMGFVASTSVMQMPVPYPANDFFPATWPEGTEIDPTPYKIGRLDFMMLDTDSSVLS